MIALILVALVLLVVAAVLLRALATPKAKPRPEPLPESALEETAGVENELSAAVRHATVSSNDPKAEDEKTFTAFKEELKRLFPRVHAQLERHEIGDRSLVFIWKGARPELKPAILCAHFDVVPADDVELWSHQPFSGDIAEGAVWGRGTQDIKLMLISSLDAAERLLAEGKAPERTIYFAFGGDEEVGGNRGAGSIGAWLEERGVKASFLLDEGGPVADGVLSFADRPVALIGIAEKGYADVSIEAEGKGGHASMPPARTASGDLARAIAAVEAHPDRARLGYTVRNFLDRLSPYVGFGYRVLFRNLWITGPLVKAAFKKGPTTNAMLRSTAAPTMLKGSPKENVLADRAWANVNMRILPGQTVAENLERISRIVAKTGAKVSVTHPEQIVEPLPESPVDHEGFKAIEAAIGQVFPDAAVLPFLFSAGTDTKHYRKVTEAMYRFCPVKETSEDLEGIHGRNEHIGVSNLRRCALFYKRLIASL
jgi:carboxypeptidase PM20D1